ncbi:MAG TPA: MMPL family transporter [Streptomyces sp.]|nr:MMPL family transporter [Streptomyces sp.]
MVALWVAVLAIAGPFAGKLGDSTRDEAVDYLPASADSTRVEELLADLPGGTTTDVIVVHHRAGGLTDADRAAAREQIAGVAGAYELGGGAAPPTVPSKDGTTLMTPLSITGLPDEDARYRAVRDIRATLADFGAPGGLTVEVGGPAALETDMEEVFSTIDGALMFGTVTVVALLLIITYRSPFLWLVPLLSVGVAASAAMALVYALIQGLDLTVSTMSTSVMTVLVFGAGTDYALLLVARYREELRVHERPYAAMLAALRGCGPAVLASCGTVVAGLLCLLAADLNSSSGLGPVGAVGVLCALAAMTTLLPALLVLLGRRVFWPLVPVHGAEPSRRWSFFARMGSSAGRRPRTILLVGALLLGALSLGVLNLPGDLREEDTFTNTPESVTAMGTLAAAYPDISSRPVTVLARTDRAAAVVERAGTVEGVARAERSRDGGGWTEIAVFAADPPESAGEKETIRALRTELRAVDGAEALVGGPSAQRLDLETTNAADRRTVIPLVLVTVLAILVLLLRSLVAPLALVAAVVASWGAAMGLGGLVFGPLFGFDGLEPGVPLLTFVFLVALGVDYGIFLMHRVREESLRGDPVPAAALRALRTTGGVIASAGVVLAATFCVLATMPMVMMVEMGFVIAVGVLLDTFLVRTYLMTSTSVLLGRWIWWPGKLFRAGRDHRAGSGTPDVARDGAPDAARNEAR